MTHKASVLYAENRTWQMPQFGRAGPNTAELQGEFKDEPREASLNSLHTSRMDPRDLMYHSENTSFAFSTTERDSISTRGNSEGKIVQDVQETRLVIGLDYGTTYTGISLMHVDGAHY
jgi:hypothetical protein